ncbi:MAG: M48 family metalloprotease [Beijerinckiaceae bacterium]
MKRYKTALASISAAMLLAACVTDPLTSEAPKPVAAAQVTLPPAPPRTTALDALSAREHQRLVAAFGGEYRAPQAQALLAELVERLGRATERPSERYRVTLLNSPVVNAFALPNGNVYLTRGLLVLANDTAEIASVIAHEMAHVITRHAVDRQELERTADLVNRVRSDVLQDANAARTLGAQGRVAIASFSRQQELEADALSVRIIARAGFDPYGATRFLDSLGRSTAIRASMLGVNPNAQGMDITATHPSAPERIQLATLAARQIGAPGMGEADRNRYLLAIQGMTVADDAGQGFLRKGVFSHPKLGLTFTAPDGFVLENSKDAVVGVSPEGGRAMRFDQVKVDASSSLESYVGSGLIDGAAASAVESLSINGLPAATSTSRSDGWSYRIYAIRNGAQTYRLTFAARDMSPALEASFKASAESFRRLTSAEIAKLRPLRVTLVTAGASDTSESLAERMALDEPRLDRFRVLNGLQLSDRIFAGQRYKLVSD